MIASLLAFSVLTMPQASAEASDVLWDLKTIEGSSGGYTSVDVGPNGSVHISYCDSNNDLKYVCMTADGSSRTMETVDNGTTAYSSIAVAADGSVHISYFDDSNGDLKYATRAPGETSWTIETLESSGDVGRFSSIAVAADDSLHISYYDQTNGDLKYATRAPGEASWTIEVVDGQSGGVSVGEYTSIAVEGNGSVHISYHDVTNEDLKYATRAPSAVAWTVETADSNSNKVGRFSSLAVDSDGRVHISYHDRSDRAIKYASKPADGSWSTEKVGDTSPFYDVIGDCSIAVTEDGSVHISSVSRDAESLYYYHMSYAVKEAGGSWTTVCIDNAMICGKGNSIATGSGNVYISYYQDTEPGRSIKCAIGELPWAPSFLNVPSNGLVTNEYEYSPQFDEAVEITYHYTDAPFLDWNGTAFVGTPGVDDVGNYYIIITAKSVEGRLSATQNTIISIAPMPVSLRINSDWEMENAVMIYGMDGNGTADNPYIITGLDIDSQRAYENSLFIGNVTYHFQVIGNHLGNTSSTYTWDSGEVAALYLFNCGNATASSNYLSDTLTGIRAYACPGAVIDANVINRAGTDGIFVNEGCDGAVISGNEVSGTGDTSGISVCSACDVTIADNEFYCGYGIYIETSDGNIIERNNCSDCSRTCIWLVCTGNSTVSNNNCNDATYGIRLSESANNTVSDNLCCRNGYTGIYLDISRDNRILNNNCSGAVNGTWLMESVNNTVSGNICCHNRNNGIYLDFSMDNIVSGNNCSWNELNGIISIGSENNIISDNECNDNDNNGDGSISGSGIRLIQSDGNRLSNNTCCSNSDGIDVWSSNDNMLVNNTCTGNIATIYDLYGGVGIFINASEGCSVVDSTCNNNYQRGIYLQNSNWSSIEGCFCDGNNFTGIYLDLSDNCTLTANTFDANSCGICLTGCRNGTISFNVVMNSDVQGVWINDSGEVLSKNNTVFGNHFIANNGATSSYNSSHVQAYGSGDNSWSQGDIGNIWSDWMSPDDDADGIVDRPYLIDGGSGIDMFPQAFALNITTTTELTNQSLLSISGTASSFSGIESLTWYNSASGMSGTITIEANWTASVPLVSGKNNITINMTGGDGISLSDNMTVFLDPELPAIAITSLSNDSLLSSSTVQVNWTAADDQGIAHFLIRLDGGNWTYLGYGNVSRTIEGLADGMHTVDVEAIDLAGNWNRTRVTFMVDTVAPSLSIFAPEGGSYFNGTVTVEWTVGDDTSGVDRCTVSDDGIEWTNANGTDHIFTLADGEHTLFVRAYDRAGNFNQTNVTVIVDTAAPSLEITCPANDSMLTSSTAIVDWAADDDRAIAHFLIRVDGGNWTYVGYGNVSRTIEGLADGWHTVAVEVIDLAGNRVTDDVMFLVDTVAPSVYITFPAKWTTFATGNVNLTWAGDDAGSGIDGYAVSIDGGQWVNVMAEHLALVLSDGNHTLTVRAYDASGNVNESTVSFIVDTTAPVLNMVAPGNGTYDNTGNVTVVWTTSDTFGIDHCAYSTDGITWTNTTRMNVTLALPDGTHIIRVRAYDVAGNFNQSSVNVTVDTVAPTATVSPSGGDISLDTVITVTFSESMDADATDITVDGVAGTTVWNGTVAVFIPSSLAYDSEYMVNVTGQDMAGNTMAISWTFSTEAHMVLVSGTLLDTDGAPIANATISVNGTVVAVTGANGSYSFQLPPGNHTAAVSADGYQDATVELNLDGQQSSLDLEMVRADEGSSPYVLYAIIVLVICLGAYVAYRRLKH